MFSFQPCDELVFATPPPQEYQQNQIMDHSLLQSNLISFSSTTNEEEQLIQTSNFGSPPPRPRRKGQSRYGSYNRRVSHRDVERKRREEMSNLYVSLRTLLPMENNKGKSSVSDQMEEATKYIKMMHEKIKELRTKRDNLKKLRNSSSSCGTNIIENSDDSNTLNNCVAVHRVVDGLEILITNKSPQFELSHVLEQLSQREFDVVSCVSTSTNGGFLHKIVITGCNRTSLDVWGLQDRLSDTIK